MTSNQPDRFVINGIEYIDGRPTSMGGNGRSYKTGDLVVATFRMKVYRPRCSLSDINTFDLACSLIEGGQFAGQEAHTESLRLQIEQMSNPSFEIVEGEVEALYKWGSAIIRSTKTGHIFEPQTEIRSWFSTPGAAQAKIDKRRKQLEKTGRPLSWIDFI